MTKALVKKAVPQCQQAGIHGRWRSCPPPALLSLGSQLGPAVAAWPGLLVPSPRSLSQAALPSPGRSLCPWPPRWSCFPSLPASPSSDATQGGDPDHPLSAVSSAIFLSSPSSVDTLVTSVSFLPGHHVSAGVPCGNPSVAHQARAQWALLWACGTMTTCVHFPF